MRIGDGAARAYVGIGGGTTAGSMFAVNGDVGVSGSLKIQEGSAGIDKLLIDDTNNNSADVHIRTKSSAGDRFWVKSQGQGYFFGDVGIGTASTTSNQKLDVVIADDTNGAGVTFRNSDGSLQFHNVAGRANQFNPQIKGNSKNVANQGLRLLGNAGSSEDSGAVPIILLRATVNNGLVSTRPLLYLENGGGVEVPLKVMADGKMGVGGDWYNGNPTAAFCVSGDASITGSVTAVGQIRTAGGALATPSFGFTDDAGLGMSRPTTQALNFITSSTEQMRIDSDGNVAIGTTTAKNLLTVKGKTTLDDDAYVSGNLYVSGAIISADDATNDHVSGLSGYFGKVGIGTTADYLSDTKLRVLVYADGAQTNEHNA